MSPILIIAYFTKDTQYQILSEELRASCNKFNLNIYLESIPNLNSWELATHYKARFIKDCLNRFTDTNLVYIDVDAKFMEYPVLFDSINCDIGYRTENFKWRANEALSGTIYLKNTPKVLSFMNTWISLNELVKAERMKPETWEQKNMQRALSKHSDIVYINLPPEYTYIQDHTKRMYPGIKPIIMHYQESRNQFKK